MQSSASTLSTQNLFFSQLALSKVCCHVTLNADTQTEKKYYFNIGHFHLLPDPKKKSGLWTSGLAGFCSKLHHTVQNLWSEWSLSSTRDVSKENCPVE